MTALSQSWRVGAASVLFVALGLGAAGCGGDGSSGDGSSGDGSSGDGSSGDDQQKPKASQASPSPSEGPTRRVQKPAEPQGEPTLGPKGEQTDVLANLPGSIKPGCVRVGKRARDIRSGDMAAGPFDAARKEYVPGNVKKRQVTLYFIPTHSEGLKSIAVRGTNARTGAKVAQASENVADAEAFKYFVVNVDLPNPGTWTISANTGQDNGCWIVDLS